MILVEVLDASEATPLQFSYMVAEDDRGVGIALHGSEQVPVLAGPLYFFTNVNVTSSDLVTDALGAPMDYLGNTTLGGEDVRIWALHLLNNSFQAFWYDTFDQEVKRIELGTFGCLDVDYVVPLDGDADSNSVLFLAPEPGITVFADGPNATNSTAARPTFQRVTLDPWGPYVEAFTPVASPRPPTPPSPPPSPPPPPPAPPSPPSPPYPDFPGFPPAPGSAQPAGRRRRNLLQASQQLNDWRSAVMTLPSLSSNNSSGARHLMQTNAVGCSLAKQCTFGNTGFDNGGITLSFPESPVAFSMGPLSKPCGYSLAAVVEIEPPVAVFGSIGFSMCTDYSNIQSITGTLGAEIGFPPVPNPAACPLTNPMCFLSWTIAAASVTVFAEPTPLADLCPPATGYPDPTSNLYDYVSKFTLASSQRYQYCVCMNNTRQRVGITMSLQGPDIPGFVALMGLVAVFPPAGPVVPVLLPFTAAVRIQNWFLMTYVPFFCGFSQFRFGFDQALSINLIFFTDLIYYLQPRWVFTVRLPDPDNLADSGKNIGGFFPEWVGDADAALDASLFGLTNAAKLLAKKLKNLDCWAAINALGGELGSATQKFFQAGYGDSNAALVRVFNPAASFASGCFNSFTRPVTCKQRLPRFKVFGKWRGGQCIAWLPSVTHCGATTKCTNCPSRPPPPPDSVVWALDNCARFKFPDNVVYILGPYGMAPWSNNWQVYKLSKGFKPVASFTKSNAQLYWAQQAAGFVWWYTSVFVRSDTLVKLDFVADTQGWAFLDGQASGTNDQTGFLVGSLDYLAVNTLENIRLSGGTYHTFSFKTYNNGGSPPAVFMAAITRMDTGAAIVTTNATDLGSWNWWSSANPGGQPTDKPPLGYDPCQDVSDAAVAGTHSVSSG